MKSFTSIIFLLLFATALAVPAGIFYTKWANRRADDAALQAPGQIVSTAAVFAGFQDKPSASAQAPDKPALTERPALSSATVPAAAAENVPTGAGAAASTQSLRGAYYSPKSVRDPFISPAEYAQIKEDTDKMLADERKQLLESRHRKKKASGENLITLQGIIGPNAIINGEMYAVGNIVRGVKVKIVKITPSYVIGEYQGKQFTKVMR